MTINRRALFRGAAALAATTATGGTGVAAKAAMSGASAVGALTQAERVSKVFEALGRSGGFPHGALSSILGIVKDVGDRSTADQLRARLNGTGDWVRDAQTGLIDFYTEKHIFNRLSQLPRGVSIMDLLRGEILDGLATPDNDIDSGGLGILGVLRRETPIDTDQVQELKDFIAPLCDADTTVDDLLGRFQGFFTKLASHAVNHPDDFERSRDGDHWDIITLMRGSPLTDLLKITKKGAQNNAALEPLAERLEAVKASRDHAKEIVREQAREKSEREYAEYQRKRDEQLKEFEAKQIEEDMTPKPQTMTLLPAGDHCFAICRRDNDPLPETADWVNWMRTIDEYARPSDIETDEARMTVTFKNEDVCNALDEMFADAEEGEFETILTLELPDVRALHNRSTLRNRVSMQSLVLDEIMFKPSLSPSDLIPKFKF